MSRGTGHLSYKGSIVLLFVCARARMTCAKCSRPSAEEVVSSAMKTLHSSMKQAPPW